MKVPFLQAFFTRLSGDEVFRTRVCFPLWAILGILSYPMFSLPFIWVAYIPLIYAVHQTSLKNVMIYGFFSALLFFVGTLFWLVAFHEASIFFAFPFCSFLFTAFLLFARYVGARFPFFRFVSVPLFLTAFEVFRSVGFIGFRWNTPADALWNQILFLQAADIIGWAGISFLVLLVNSVVAEILILWKDGRSLRQAFITGIFPFYVGMFCFFADIAYGVSSMQRWSEIVDKQLATEKIALIQPNRPGSFNWHSAEPELFTKFENMVQSAVNQNARLVVQTEIMTLDYLWQNLENLGKDHPFNQYSSQLVELPRKYDIPMVLTHFDNNTGTGKSYNAATFVDYNKNGEIQTNTYRKIHIVPFGEWIPGARNISWIRNILDSLGAAWASPGEDFTIMKDRAGRSFAMLICFEDIYASLARIFVDKGVSYFINATNDGWAYKWKLGAKTPLWQHLANTVHTSISLRRSIARSVNTGVTAVVDPLGRIDYSGIPEYTDGVYVADVKVMPEGYRTQYVRSGWFLEYFFFILAGLFLFRALLTDKKAKTMRKILN